MIEQDGGLLISGKDGARNRTAANDSGGVAKRRRSRVLRGIL